MEKRCNSGFPIPRSWKSALAAVACLGLNLRVLLPLSKKFVLVDALPARMRTPSRRKDTEEKKEVKLTVNKSSVTLTRDAKMSVKQIQRPYKNS